MQGAGSFTCFLPPVPPLSSLYPTISPCTHTYTQPLLPCLPLSISTLPLHSVLAGCLHCRLGPQAGPIAAVGSLHGCFRSWFGAMLYDSGLNRVGDYWHGAMIRVGRGPRRCGGGGGRQRRGSGREAGTSCLTSPMPPSSHCLPSTVMVRNELKIIVQ